MYLDTEQIKRGKRCEAGVYLNRGEAECEHVCELLMWALGTFVFHEGNMGQKKYFL